MQKERHLSLLCLSDFTVKLRWNILLAERGVLTVKKTECTGKTK